MSLRTDILTMRRAGRTWQWIADRLGLTRAKVWQVANPEKIKACRDAWTCANRERARASSAAWKRRNPERHRAHGRAWEARNPERRREIDRASHARRVSAAQWEQIADVARSTSRRTHAKR